MGQEPFANVGASIGVAMCCSFLDIVTDDRGKSHDGDVGLLALKRWLAGS